MALSVYREVAGWRISRVGGGSAFYVRHQADADCLAMDLSGDFGSSEAGGEAARFRFERFGFEPVVGRFEP